MYAATIATTAEATAYMHAIYRCIC